MSEINVILDAELEVGLTRLMALAKVAAAGPKISGQDVNQAVDKLKARLDDLEDEANGPKNTAVYRDQSGQILTALPEESLSKTQSVLMVGEVGVITFQVKRNLTKIGAQVVVAKGVDEAIAAIQRQLFSMVLIDLYMPTEQEGLIVLEEVKRLSRLQNMPVQVLVLCNPVKEKNLRELCKEQGADYFLEKVEGWHKVLSQFYLGKAPPQD